MNEKQNNSSREHPEVIVVSGLPRSGTSLMMQMLKAGGLTLVEDGFRKPDRHNPLGYFETEHVKKLQKDGDWLGVHRGKVVKIVSSLLPHLPKHLSYKVLFLRRNEAEIAESQQKMLLSQGKKGADLSSLELQQALHQHVEDILRWCQQQKNICIDEYHYANIIDNPLLEAKRINNFLDQSLDLNEMAKVVTPSLYRCRHSQSKKTKNLPLPTNSQTNNSYDWIILGGGWTGTLSLAAITSNGQTALAIEKELAGGLARTLRTEDCLWDLGPHALYSQDKNYIKFLEKLPLEYVRHQRNVKVCHQEEDGKFIEVEYPFEFGLSNLPRDVRNNIISDFKSLAHDITIEPANLLEWMEKRLGKYLSALFMKPYNTKLWAVPLEQICISLVESRIHPPTIEQLLSICQGTQIEGRLYQKDFLYPIEGIGALSAYLKSTTRGGLLENTSVTAIQRNRNGWRIKTNRGSFTCKQMLSTIPLPQLMNLLGYSTKSIFHSNTTCFVVVALKPGLKFRRFDNCHWTFHAKNEIFYRLTFMHNFSPKMKRAVVAEITMNNRRNSGSPQLFERFVVRDLIRLGIISSDDDIKCTDSVRVGNTYPIPTIGLSTNVKKLETEFAQMGISLLGRNGRWDYHNMDTIWKNVNTRFGELH